jgi:hypothetical protein
MHTPGALPQFWKVKILRQTIHSDLSIYKGTAWLGVQEGGLQEQGHFLCSFETYRQQTPGVDDQIHEQGQQQMAGNYFSGENHISLDPVVHIPVPTI